MGKRLISSERRELSDRLRKIREGAGYTQEGFAEILGISLSAYKKIESGENQLTLDELRRLDKKLKVSADYLLFGERENLDETWKMIQNCTDYDKLFLMLRLFSYFTKLKNQKFLDDKSLMEYDEKILQLLEQFDKDVGEP